MRATSFEKNFEREKYPFLLRGFDFFDGLSNYNPF